MPKISEAEFDALVRRAGMTLSPQQRSEIYRAYGVIEMLTERLRQPRRFDVEPATIYTLGGDHTA